MLGEVSKQTRKLLAAVVAVAAATEASLSLSAG